MIHLIHTEAKRFRTFGWVQDPTISAACAAWWPF